MRETRTSRDQLQTRPSSPISATLSPSALLIIGPYLCSEYMSMQPQIPPLAKIKTNTKKVAQTNTTHTKPFWDVGISKKPTKLDNTLSIR